MKLPKEIEKEIKNILTRIQGDGCGGLSLGDETVLGTWYDGELEKTTNKIKQFIATTLSKQEQQVRESERKEIEEEILKESAEKWKMKAKEFNTKQIQLLEGFYKESEIPTSILFKGLKLQIKEHFYLDIYRIALKNLEILSQSKENKE